MTLHLIKKDFLLAKKFIWATMGLVTVLPLLVVTRAPELSGAGSFFLTAVFAELILGQYISMTELKYPKAEALLCSSPYSRGNLVMAKYLFFLVIFAYCCVIYGAMALILPGQAAFSLDAALFALLGISIVYGIYTPFQFKLGVEKTKYVFMVILFGASFGAPVIFRGVSKMDPRFWENIPLIALRIAMALTAVLILALSAWVSVKIYSKKEL